MVAEQDICFRLRGVPSDWDEACVTGTLDRIFRDRKGPGTTTTVRSLALDPTRTQPRKTATLNFGQIPVKLRDQNRVCIGLSKTDDPMELDKDFFGFTSLHRVPDELCDIDIIAISGFRGHAFGSFKCRCCGNMWLRDFLPNDFERARVFIYGYDTVKSSSQTIIELGRTFVEKFRALRANTKWRPWIIIGHSLGGLVAKEAITSLAESDKPEDVEIYQQLRAVLFFGVPNKGMITEIFAPTASEEKAQGHLAKISDATLKNLIEIIDKVRPAFLRNLHTRFIKAGRKLDRFTTYNFYETQISPADKSICEKLKNFWHTGSSNIVDLLLVSGDSATQGFLDDDDPKHKVFPVHSNHSDLVKFTSANDDVYKTVIRCLSEIRADPGPIRRIRKEPRDLTDIEKEFLHALIRKSLQQEEHDDGIQPQDETCQWLDDHEIYQEWYSSRQSLLWILGYPGSGKSTLILSETRRLSELEEEHVVAKFFVWNHWHGCKSNACVTRSPVGLYRRLLLQILPSFPNHLQKLAQDHKEAAESTGNSLCNETKVQRYFFSVLEKVCGTSDRAIFLFIDGLDEMEYDGAQRVIIAFIRFLEKPRWSKLNLKVCISCRYSPNLRDGGLAISVDSENAQDIESFVKYHPTIRRLGLKREGLQNLIIKRAHGSFRWVSSVLEFVSELRRTRVPVAAIMAEVQNFPREEDSWWEKLRALKDMGDEDVESEFDGDEKVGFDRDSGFGGY